MRRRELPGGHGNPNPNPKPNPNPDPDSNPNPNPNQGARAALDAVEQHAARRQLLLEPSAARAELPQRLEFVLQAERVYAAFADAAHARWGTKKGR